jgi:bidirectional [NiFe] hydrogenase diaphorase subunit
MDNISLTIDGKRIRALQDKTILWAALENGIYIPNLCAIQDRVQPSASCRLCFVEVEGESEPVVACTEPVKEGMVGHCLKNRSCELQRVAKHLGIKLTTKRFRKLERNLPIDESSSLFIYDPNKCVLCGKCVWVCQEKLSMGAIGFTRRGFKRMVSTFQDKPLGESLCGQCAECVKVCPVGALTFKNKDFQPQRAPK